MSNNDKPFACSFPGCNEKFITEDRLSVHIQKHDLNFDSLTASLFTDQTPTPTTFLRDCDNLGLFQDLPLASKNPFDESFRKAVTDPDADSEGNGADTPSIPLLPDSANILGTIDTPTSSKDLPSFMKYRPVFLTPDVNKLQSQISNGNLDTPSIDDRRSMKRAVLDSPITPTTSGLVLGLPRPTRSRKSSTSTLSDGGGAESVLSLSSSADIMGADSPITVPGGSVSEDDVITGVSNSIKPESSIPTLTTTKVAISTAPTIVLPSVPQKLSASLPLVTPALQPTNSNTQSLVMLHIDKLGGAYLIPTQPQGVAGAQTIPNRVIPIPVSVSPAPVRYQVQVNGAQKVAQTTTTTTVSQPPPAESQSSLALAKMKLKQALTKQVPTQQAAANTTLSDSETSSTRSRHSSSPTRGLKRMYSRSDNDDEEMDKRLKSLQRNRDAARRCRKKKKVFMQSLEERLKASNQIIAQLQSENTKLKVEIAQLKSLFIAHKDCEVTKKQISEGSLTSYPLS